MVSFEKMGVYLNGEPGDDEALAFAGRLAQFAQTRSLLCVHVRGVEDVPIGPEPDEEEVRKHVLGSLPGAVAAICTVEVHRDTGIRHILKHARDLSLDLIVVGRRLPHDQRAVGSAFIRLARKAPCSVLVVPDQARAHFARVVATSDGSEHSKLALRGALEIARASGEPHPQVIVQTIYTVGYGYRYSGLSFADAVRQKEEVYRQKMDALIAAEDCSGVEFESVLMCSPDPCAAVFDVVSARHFDLITVGSRGKSATAAALLGSFAERLLTYAPVPVLVVKQKGETLRFLDAFLGN